MNTRRVALGIVILTAALITARAESKMMSVQVKQGPVRSTPSFVGPIVATLSYGDRVTVAEERPGWMRVSTAGGTSGWMHQSALSEKKIVLRAGANVQSGASGDEMALAGKGFNSDVEAQFKAQNREIDFGPVDRMEKRSLSQADMAAFLKDGGLHPREGGAR